MASRGEGGGVLLTPNILGPSPGLSIIRIWQGVVEICLRLSIAICCLCAVGFAGTASASESSLEGSSKAAGVFVAVFSCVAAIVEVLLVVLRFLNIGAINLQMRKFFIVDIAVSLLLVVGFVASAIMECVFAAKLESRDDKWWKQTAAAAALCFVSAVLAGVLAVWSVLFIVRRWYYKLLQYMSLP